MIEKICGTCGWHKRSDAWPDDWVCVNGDSEYCADWTSYTDSCSDWEERK